MEHKIRIDEKWYSLITDDNYLSEMGPDFEPHMVELFKVLVEPSDVIFDVGANIGLTAILFSNLGRVVVAFEPSPSTFYYLQENIKRAELLNTK